MAVVLLVGRYADMADAAAEILAPSGHRCLRALDPVQFEHRVTSLEHDLVVLGPSLSPPERDRIEALSLVTRSDVPVVHVRTVDEAVELPAAVNDALDQASQTAG